MVVTEDTFDKVSKLIREEIARYELELNFHFAPQETTQMLVRLYIEMTGTKPPKNIDLLEWFYAEHRFDGESAWLPARVIH